MTKNITFGKRILIILIDYLFLGILCYLGYLLIGTFYFKNITIPVEITNWVNSNGTIEELANLINNSLEVKSFTNDAIGFIGILVLLMFILNLIYFIIIPILWKKQTLGRWIIKARLVKENNSEVRTGSYIVREIIGNTFICGTTAFLGIIPIINVVLMITKNHSLADLISGTKLVDCRIQTANSSNTITADNEDIKDISEE